MFGLSVWRTIINWKLLNSLFFCPFCISRNSEDYLSTWLLHTFPSAWNSLGKLLAKSGKCTPRGNESLWKYYIIVCVYGTKSTAMLKNAFINGFNRFSFFSSWILSEYQHLDLTNYLRFKWFVCLFVSIRHTKKVDGSFLACISRIKRLI